MSTTWPALKDVRAYLRMQPDPNEDLVIQAALAAAVEYGVAKYNNVYPADAVDVPDSGALACKMHAARLYRRRDTVDGTIGFGDLGVVRVGKVDADVEALYAILAPLVFG